MQTPQLSDGIERVLRITQRQQTILRNRGFISVADLLYHFPSRYENVAPLEPVAAIVKGKAMSIRGTLSHLAAEKTWNKKVNITKARLTDESGVIDLVWFHQPYISRMLKEGETYIFTGTVGERKGKQYL